MSYQKLHRNLSIPVYLIQIESVDAYIAQLTTKRNTLQNTPRRQCSLNPGPRGEAGVLGKVRVWKAVGGEISLGRGATSLGRERDVCLEGETSLGRGETSLGRGETSLGRGETSLGRGETSLGMGNVSHAISKYLYTYFR